MKARIQIIAIAGVVLTLLLPGATSGASPTPGHHRTDVTTTVAGQKMAREAASRYGSLGVAARTDGLAVIEDDKGWVIAPKGLEPEIDDASGQVTSKATARPANTGYAQEMRPVVRLQALLPRADTASVAPLADPQPYWQLTNSACWSRLYANSGLGYMDTCFKSWKMQQEYNLGRDDFLIETFATVTGYQGSGLEWAWIDTSQYGSVAQYWVDWAPAGSTSGGCRTIPLGLGASYAGVGASISSAFTACEQLDITKGNPAVWIHENWDYCQTLCFQGMRGSRGLKTQEWIYVGQGKWPIWDVNWSVG